MSSVLWWRHWVLVGGTNAIQVVRILLFTEGNLSWQACLKSVQILHALDMKTKATPLDMCQSKSHKALDVPTRI